MAPMASNGAGLSSPYVELDRAAWARLRQQHPMRLSPEDEIGRNSSALQVGESLTGAVTLAVTGVVFGLFYGSDPHAAFVGTLAVAVSVGAVSVLSAWRTRP